MKVTIFQKSGLVLMLALAPFLGGCEQQAHSADVNAPAPVMTDNQPPAELTATDTNEPVATNDDALANADGKLISTPAMSSTNISNNPQLGDFVKLVQAGVGESVLLAYVTNSSTAFNLSSDDIVYLNDLGAPETTITAMLQRDQYYNGSAATAPAPMTAPTAETAPAPAQAPIPDQNAMAQTPPLTPSPEVEQEVQQSPNGSYSYFYDSLSPYGNWVDITGYGPCWQPTVVVANPGWQPYGDRGHWAYTDTGWCWVSDYSWGWAPFHYGRWFHHNRFGWCWAPDTVWGPAWVSWRYSDAYCGWAPLPPAACYRPGFGFTYYGRSVGFNFTFGLGVNRFLFVPMNHFHDRSPGRFRVEHREVTKIYNTTIINNQIIRGNNNTLINRGVPVDRVARATHTDIRPIHIRADADGPRTSQLGRDGRSLSVFRPELPQPRTGTAPRLVGEGVRPAPDFNLHSRVERRPIERSPVVTSAPERRPIISNPGMNRPIERPGQTPSANFGRGRDLQPQLPGQPNRGDNNQRTVTPPLRPQGGTPAQGFNSPAPARPDNNPRGNDLGQERQQRQLLEQQPAQQQQRDVSPRQQREFQPQPTVPIPRQEAPPRSVDVPRVEPRVNNNPDSNPGFRTQPPVRSEPVAPPRTFETRPAPEVRSAPPQYSAPARESRSDNGGGNGNGNGNANGNGSDRGNGRGNR